MKPDYEITTAPPGSTLYYSVLFSPLENRQAIIALHAFHRAIATGIDKCSDEQVARTKLQWWHMELIRLFDGKPSHPITQALLPIIKNFQLPIEILQSLIDHPDIEHLVKLIAAYIPSEHQTDLAPYAQNLALSMQLIDNIVNLRKILQPGQQPPSLAELEQQADQARNYYQKALQELPTELRPSQLSQLIFAELQLTLLSEIQKSKFNVLTHQTQLTPLRKLWIAWRIKYREKSSSLRGAKRRGNPF